MIAAAAAHGHVEKVVQAHATTPVQEHAWQAAPVDAPAAAEHAQEAAVPAAVPAALAVAVLVKADAQAVAVVISLWSYNHCIELRMNSYIYLYMMCNYYSPCTACAPTGALQRR